jgi:hypothetical protein
VDFDQLIELLLHGSLSPDTAVWHAGLSEWVKATTVPDIVSQLPPPLPPAALPTPDPDRPPPLESAEGDDIDDDDDTSAEGVSFEPLDGAVLEAPPRRRRRHRHRARGSEPRWDLLAILAVALIVLVMVLWRMFRQGDAIPSGIVGAAVHVESTEDPALVG